MTPQHARTIEEETFRLLAPEQWAALCALRGN